MSKTNEEIQDYLNHLKRRLIVFEACGLIESDGYRDMKTAISIIEDLLKDQHDRNWLMKNR